MPTRAQTNAVLRLAEAFTEAQQAHTASMRERGGVSCRPPPTTGGPCPSCRVLIQGARLAVAVRRRQGREYVL
jgi:hypothetical protein